MRHRTERGAALTPLVGILAVVVVLLAACELDEEPVPGSGNGEMIFLRISDLSGGTCSADPGADIDAVELLSGGQRVAYAGWARYDPPAQTACSNGFADADQVLDAPEARPDSGFLSLNGGAVVVEFVDGLDALVIEPGFEVNVLEGAATHDERVSLSVGPTEDGPWTAAATNVGDGRTTLSFTAPTTE